MQGQPTAVDSMKNGTQSDKKPASNYRSNGVQQAAMRPAIASGSQSKEEANVLT